MAFVRLTLGGLAWSAAAGLLVSLTPAVAVTTPAADHPWPRLDRAPVATSAHHPQPYVVRPGDSLWNIAERHLRVRGAASGAADVARAWPTWWAANRDVVGADPDLIHPGQHLVAPAREGS